MVETDLVLPFLEDRVAGPGQYLTNGMGFGVEIDGPDGEGTFRLCGRTDPVITDEAGSPLLPTEVKTVRDLDRLDGPRDRHLAQVHAYLVALSDRIDGDLADALLVYVSKSTLDVQSFHVRFDEAFWEAQVRPWMAALTRFRAAAELPPADPQTSWECDLCRFKRRCGQTDHPVADAGPRGFVPRYEYPRAAVRSHLDATDAPLTPTLAMAHPDLANEKPVDDWTCLACGATYAFGEIDWADTAELPDCPACRTQGHPVELGGPFPGEGWPSPPGDEPVT